MNDDFVIEYIHGRHSVRDYFDSLVSDGSLDHAWAGCPELAAACREHLWSAFAEVDAIPRGDVFWRNSNMRITFTKVGDFYVKNADPQLRDPKGAWQAFAVAVCRGHSYERSAAPGREAPWLPRAGRLFRRLLDRTRVARQVGRTEQGNERDRPNREDGSHRRCDARHDWRRHEDVEDAVKDGDRENRAATRVEEPSHRDRLPTRLRGPPRASAQGHPGDEDRGAATP